MGGKSRKRGQVSKKLIDRLLKEKEQSQRGENKKSEQPKKQKGLL